MRLDRRELFEKFVPGFCPDKEQKTDDADGGAGGDVSVLTLQRRTAILGGLAIAAGIGAGCAAQKQIPPLPRISGINPEHWAEMSGLERQLLTTLESNIISLNQVCDRFFNEYDGVDFAHLDIGKLDPMFHGYINGVSGLSQLYEDVIDLYNAMKGARGEEIGPFFEIEMARLANLFIPEDDRKKRLQTIKMGFRSAFGRFVTEVDDETFMEGESFSGVYVLLANVDSIVGDDALHAFAVYTARNAENGNLRAEMLWLEDDKRNPINPETKGWLEDDLKVKNLNLPTYIVMFHGRPIVYFHHVKKLNAALLDETVRHAVERFKEYQENQEEGDNRGESLDI